MCYKTDKHRAMAVKLSEKMENVPKFITDYYSRFKSETSKSTYWPYLENLLQWLYDKKIVSSQISGITPEELNKVTSTDVINHLKSLQNGIGCAVNRLSTIETKKNSFSAFWSYLVKQKFVDDNVVKDIPAYLFKSEIENHTVKIPTQEQIDTFLENLEIGNRNNFDCIRNVAIVQLFLGSGIRSEELMGLDLNDLHLDEDTPYIEVLGKGKQEYKDKVLINTKAKYYLEEYLDIREEFIIKKDIIEQPALFLSNHSKRLSKTPIASFFSEYSNGEINPHMLRHWVGTKLYEDTHDIVLVQRQLRHKNLETTAAYYVHTSEDNMASAIERLAS